MVSTEHKQHIAKRQSWNNCPECRADTSRRFAVNQPFHYAHVHEYLSWIKPRLEAIRTGENGGSTVDARIWHREFMAALHNRISSHMAATGRKHAPEYAKYHLATYGNDWRYLNTQASLLWAAQAECKLARVTAYLRGVVDNMRQGERE